MRFRNFSEAITSRSYRERWWSNQPLYDYDNNVLVTRTDRYNRMLDVVTPKFDKVRNNGGIVCSPMYRVDNYSDIDHTITWLVGHAGSYPFKWDFHTSLGLGSSLRQFLVNGSTDTFNELFEQFSAYEALAITRAHADVDISEMQLLATVGELPETLDWIKSLITRAINLTRAFNSKAERSKILKSLLYNKDEATGKGAIKHATRRYEHFVQLLESRKQRKIARSGGRNLVDDFSSLWLEYRYAIRPLIVDIQNALKVLSKVIKSQRLTARGHEYAIGK